MRTPLMVAATGAVAVVMLASCSTSDDGDGAQSSSPPTTDVTTTTTTATNTTATTTTTAATATTATTTTMLEAPACDAEPVVLTTESGTEFVRTPDACFDDLPDWPYAPEYVEIDGLRQAYVDEGPADGDVVLLLHGQPSWSYLYRDMIPV
ncbi:MAG: hypothetical protein AAFY28_03460, partial [Actinomycetota bacterium]